MDDKSTPTIRKAAVLVRSLPPEAAAALIARLSPEEAASLRASVAALDEVGSDERRDVADALRDGHKPEATATVAALASESGGGVELQLGTRVDAPMAPPAPVPAAAPVPTPPPPRHEDAFDALRDADPAAVATYLAGEQPRAVALVLSSLPADASARVLAEYSDAEQAQLLVQMSRLGEADPTSVRVIAAGLAEWIAKQDDEQRRLADRTAGVRAILAASPEGRRRKLASQLLKTDPKLAEAIGLKPAPKPSPAKPAAPAAKPATPPLRFDDLERLDQPTLVAALGGVAARVALLALAGASDALLARVESGLPKRSVKDLRKRLANLGPTTLAEVERAQAMLVAAADRLVAQRRTARAAATK